ncbi:MAG: 3-oxo-tetronate kinase [Pseudomonadota bacterium]
MSVILGAIADDFTGATDLANTLVKQGMPTAQIIGVPGADLNVPDARAVVVALKSRTAPAAKAVDDSLTALNWLRRHGARQILFKYCSTFDSTAEGNIGPVADAMMAAMGSDFALICPAFPGVGRTVYQGKLFVNDRLLNESPMREHPLTPMRDADLLRLMAAQSGLSVGLVPWADVRAGPAAVSARIDALRASGVGYGVIDAIEDEDLATIGRVAADHALITGGSGIATGLPRMWREAGVLTAAETPAPPQARGRALILAGSCSEATRAQIAHAKTRMPTARVDGDALMAGAPVADRLSDWVLAQAANRPALIYASASPEDVAAAQARYGAGPMSEAIEGCLARIASMLVPQGIRRLVVAGGETSGAIVSALGIKTLRICHEIDLGVPWTEAEAEAPLALALKSGNFGGSDFFTKAFEVLR